MASLYQMCLYFILYPNEKNHADYRFTSSSHIIPQLRTCCMRRPQETQMAKPKHTFRKTFRIVQPRIIRGLRPGVMLDRITCAQSRWWSIPICPWTNVNRFCVDFVCRGNQHCITYIFFLSKFQPDPLRPALSFMTLVVQSPRLNLHLWRGGHFNKFVWHLIRSSGTQKCIVHI
jgi:hypothetical protein